MTRARALLLWAGAALVADSWSSGPVERCLLLLIEVNVILATKAPSGSLRRPFAVAAFASFFAIALVTAESHSGTHMLFTLPYAIPLLGGPWTLEAAAYGASIATGLAAAMLAAAPLVTALNPEELVDALPSGAERIGATLGITLTLLPRLTRSVAAIRECNALRSGTAVARFRWRGVLAPAFLTAIEDSVQLAEAMEARGYGSGHRRTPPKPAARGLGVWIAAGGAALSAVLMLLLAFVHPVAAWAPFPAVTLPGFDVARVAALLPLLLAVGWRSS